VEGSGKGWGTGPAKVVIEEPLANVPDGLQEVSIDSGAGTSCHFRLNEGERYVLFAYKTKDGRLGVGGCTNSFPIAGKEYILEALRNKARKGPPRLIGTVRKSDATYGPYQGLPGVRVTVRSAERAYEAVSGGDGQFEFLGILPDRYQIEVAKPGFQPDTEYNHNLVLSQGILPPSAKDSPSIPAGSALIENGGCSIVNLRMWPDGGISGRVTDQSGRPLPDVPVQAFPVLEGKERDSHVFRTATTDAAGRYALTTLPNGKYIVGVNGEKYKDSSAYPPTFHASGKDGSQSSLVYVPETGVVQGVDIVLPPRRVAATLLVRAVAPADESIIAFSTILNSEAGTPRWRGTPRTPIQESISVPVYIGERYFVHVWATGDLKSGYASFSGTVPIEVTGTGLAVTIPLQRERLP